MLALGAMVAALSTTPLAAAESPGVDADEQTIVEELKALEDPTILTRRIWLDTEWNSFRDSSNDVEVTLGGLWAWRVSANQDWAVRLKVPVKFHSAGDAVGDSNEQGLGDIKLATGTAVRLSQSWRAGGGVEMRFPSATDDLGGNAWRPQLFAAVAWDVTRQLTLSPSAEYNRSIAEEHGAPRQHFLEMFFPATFVLPRYWSVTARYEAKVDFESDDQTTHSAKLQVAKQLERLPFGFSLSIKKPFDGGEKRFQVNFVTTYYFR
jgi:hypothetical protein